MDQLRKSSASALGPHRPGLPRSAWVRALAVSCVCALGSVTPALACDFGHVSNARLYELATDIFIGTVTEPGITTATLRFKVLARYKGADEPEMASAAGMCAYGYIEGRTYLIFGTRVDGRFQTGQPLRPLDLFAADTRTQRQLAVAFQYLQARAEGRPQGELEAAVRVAGGASADVRDSAGSLALLVRRMDGAVVTVQLPFERGGYAVSLAPGRYRVSVLGEIPLVAEEQEIDIYDRRTSTTVITVRSSNAQP